MQQTYLQQDHFPQVVYQCLLSLEFLLVVGLVLTWGVIRRSLFWAWFLPTPHTKVLVVVTVNYFFSMLVLG